MSRNRWYPTCVLVAVCVGMPVTPAAVGQELILHWRFGAEGDNVEDDASGQGHLGHMLYGHFRDLPPDRASDGVHGVAGGSVRLDAGSRVASMTPIELPRTWTLSFWVRPASHQSDEHGAEPDPLELSDIVSMYARSLGPSVPWYFQADPDETGHDQNWHHGDNAEDWQRMPVPSFWINTHVRGYMGVGWYRTRFFVPEDLADMNHKLHFEGVDAEAWVYVNGNEVGRRTAASTGKALEDIWDEPFSVTVGPEHIRAGQDNVLVVRCRSAQLADRRYGTVANGDEFRAAYPLGNAGMFLASYFMAPDDHDHQMDLAGLNMAPLEPGQWTHVALVVGPERAKLYVNGTVASSVARDIWSHDLRRVALEFTQPHHGQMIAGIDDVRLYGAQLSAERLARFSAGVYRPDAPWVAAYPHAMQQMIHAGRLSQERVGEMQQLGAPDAATLIERLGAHEDVDGKVRVIFALGMIGGVDAALALIRGLEADDGQVRDAATRALSDLQKRSGILSEIEDDALAAALEHGGWEVRRFAARTLHERGVQTGKSLIEFADVTGEVGLSEHLENWHLGHGGAWGDVTGNGRPDLYIGSFADRGFFADTDAPIPNMLFLNDADGFTLSPDESVRLDMRGRPSRERYRVSMALFADLTGDGRLDLLVGNHRRPNRLFENRWPDGFRDVTPQADDGGWPMDLDLRNATAVDLDRDGLLDLVLVDGSYRGRGGRRLLALRNRGDFTFESIGEQIGFPDADTPGLGLAVGDINNDGHLDFFVAQSNRMIISRPDGSYQEYRPGFFKEPVFSPAGAGPSGAVLADMTGNGLLDLVFTNHGIPPQVFIYINRGIDEDGMPEFANVTEEAGLNLPFVGGGVALPNASDDRRHRLLGAHLALVDLDNSGRRDILLAMTHLDEMGRLQPLVLRNKAVVDGIPRFSAPPVDKLAFYCTTPVTDYDRDGRVDIFMASWYQELDSYMFRNVTEGGNYLSVSVVGRSAELNSMGIGAVVRVYESGGAGNDRQLLGRGDIVLGQGYSAGDEARVHFGLGDVERCDVVVTWQGHRVTLESVEVNRHIEVEVGSGG